MDEQQLNQRIRELVGDLYLNNYMYDFYYTGSIENKNVQAYIINDFRFKEYYNDYASSTDKPLKKSEWIKHLFNEEPKTLYNIIKEFFNLPDEMKPEKIYVNEDYPWRFELMPVFKEMTYDEFFMDKHSEFIMTIKKIFNDLTSEEIKRRFIVWLENENKKKEAEIEQRRKERLPQRKIYKYNKNGILDKIYNDRNECWKAEGITKAALSMHLAGKRKTLKGFTYKEV